MTSYEAAKKAILRISEKFGHLDEAVLDKLEKFDPDVRKQVERSLCAKDNIAGHAIITLAQNIYGSDARFVFELLQNADDNRFTKAHASGSPPSVSFHIYTDRIVVECNEDGFNEENLKAICSVGRSSKSAAHGYIGAKGIGFKSVFIAAWKVHIQSGYYSFYFKHKRGDSGLGMVVPIWQDTEDMLQEPLTRMTLYLHDTKAGTHLDYLRETIFKQLSELQETSLLFLRNLKKINVSFYDDNDGSKRSRSFKSVNTDNHNVILETTETGKQGDSTTYTKQFHVTRHMASNLSRSVSRQVPDTNAAKEAAAMAEVVLAFPLTSSSEPLLQKQDLFAFLPVRKSDFKFIIQSDFDTSANRQDIITSSRRNIDLLDAIAHAFLRAVLEFCEHPDLCYTWPSFLPLSQHEPTEFWSGLRDKIQSRVCEIPILMARHGPRLRNIDDVVVVASDFEDDEGNPLLDNSEMDVFLSGRYPPSAVTALREYGLGVFHGNLLLNMLRADLESPTSKMKSTNTNQRWHSIMAQLLAEFVNDSQFLRLTLLPLSSGDWVSPDSGLVYLPTAEEIPVPPGLKMRILDPAAVANDDRRAFYMQCGATEPSVAEVRTSIRGAYSDGSQLIDLAQSRAHLHFLYLSHLSEPKPVRNDYLNMYVHTDGGRTETTCSQDVFLPTDHPYGAWKLLGPEEGVPGFNFASLHPGYLLDAPAPPNLRHLTWTKWLCDFIGIRERLRLVARKGNALSDIWTHVATHRPNKLLGLLEHLWKYEGSQISHSDVLKTLIRGTSADKLCASPLSKTCTLEETFLPLASMKRHCARFMEHTEPLPFLKFETKMLSERLRAKWLFLHEVFLVGNDDDLPFLLNILFWIKQANPDASTVARHQRLVDLYVVIDAKFVASIDRESNRQLISEFTKENECLYVPPSDGDPAGWTSAPYCVWDGPPGMICRYSLKDIFTQSLGADQVDQISHFFQHTLRIPDASCEDIIEELQSIKNEGCHDFDRISMLYECISANADADEEMRRNLRDSFAEKRLIYVLQDGTAGWYKTSECLWSSTTNIRGKVTLNDLYEDMRDFFVDMLDVKMLTIRMVYDELLQTNSQSSITEVKGAIWSLNALLQSEPGAVEPEPLLRKKIFPVSFPNGTKELVNADTDFSIGDREYLTAQFRDRIKMLDYDLAEIRQLKTFLEWMKLSNRYLSASVKEITSANNENAWTVSSATRNLKRKAHALLRIAATFDSPRYTANGTGLYESLRSMETIATNEISSIMSLFQDGRSVDVESRKGDVHIGEVDGSITVYVPRDKRKQEYCFASPLPKNLTGWLMRDPVTQIQELVDEAMVTALTTLLAVAPSAVDLILDHQGIIQVPIANEDIGSHEDDAYVDSVDDEDGNEFPVAISTPVADDDPMTSDFEALEGFSGQARAAYGGRSGYRSTYFSSYSAHTDADHQYRELLDKVVRAARRAQFPLSGLFDMSALRSTLSGDDTTGYNGFEAENTYHSNNQFERNFKIGAAGELYVFEIISALDPTLRGWSRENWQSNIRGRVSVHEDYAGMEGWGGQETADLVYNDSHGDLTAMLIDCGYLDGNEWILARPFYYIEVKTTTGPCNTPFYMSKGQYQRMTNIHNSKARSEVYLILRVFEIESESRIGMKVYVDPEQLKLDEELIFTCEKWSIIPGTA